jgi:hypothetical protein
MDLQTAGIEPAPYGPAASSPALWLKADISSFSTATATHFHVQIRIKDPSSALFHTPLFSCKESPCSSAAGCLRARGAPQPCFGTANQSRGVMWRCGECRHRQWTRARNMSRRQAGGGARARHGGDGRRAWRLRAPAINKSGGVRASLAWRQWAQAIHTRNKGE